MEKKECQKVNDKIESKKRQGPSERMEELGNHDVLDIYPSQLVLDRGERLITLHHIVYVGKRAAGAEFLLRRRV